MLQEPDLTALLPDEVLARVFGALPVRDVLSLRRVCARWRRVAMDRAVWRGQAVACTAQRRSLDSRGLNWLMRHAPCLRRLELGPPRPRGSAWRQRVPGTGWKCQVQYDFATVETIP